jgi:hypothetical protein
MQQLLQLAVVFAGLATGGLMVELDRPWGAMFRLSAFFNPRD